MVDVALSKSSRLQSFIYLFIIISTVSGGYVITTPRVWKAGQQAEVCFTFVKNITLDEIGPFVRDKFNIKVTTIPVVPHSGLPWLNGTTTPLPETIIDKPTKFPEGSSSFCQNVQVPSTYSGKVSIEISGTVAEKELNHTVNATITDTKQMYDTFIQTDKYKYKPGQMVQFRLLTLYGPYLKMSTDEYSEIYIQSPYPANVRIAQWLNVKNPDGLIHLNMQLSPEPKEGTYTIVVKSPNSGQHTTRFVVEEYVLPRYEVSIQPVKLVYGDAKNITVTVCAKYTYGEPVKGTLNVTLNNNARRSCRLKHTESVEISGCQSVTVETRKLRFGFPSCYIYRIGISAKVIEADTDVILHADRTNINIERTAILFSDLAVGKDKVLIPYFGKVKAYFPDDTPASGELMELCWQKKCRNITTGEDGIINFVLPPFLQYSNLANLVIKAVNYPTIVSNTTAGVHTYMYASEFRLYKSINIVHSPSNSSLHIMPINDINTCIYTNEQIQIQMQVLFTAVNQSDADITVQVISRGQVQYLSTNKYELNTIELPINKDHLIDELPTLPKFTTQGYVNITINVPKTISPKPKVLLWYSRYDGEIVSDYMEVDVKKCLHNHVKMEWSATKVQPKEKVTLSLSAHPSSTCSLGVVDKSVDLLASENKRMITINKIFAVLNGMEINTWVNIQSDDAEYCARIRANKSSDVTTTVKPLIIDDSTVDKPIVLDSNTTNDAPPPGEKRELSKRSISPPWRRYGYTNEDDAYKMFEQSGLFVLTDLTVETRRCQQDHFGTYEDDIQYSISSPSNFGAGGASADGAGSGGFSGGSSGGSDFANKNPDSAGPPSSSPRTYFPETWLWDLEMIDSSGKFEKPLEMPDTITEWVGAAVCVHPDVGVGLSGSSSITTFTPFFIDLTLPPIMTRGEILPLKISVFNYLEQQLPVSIHLKESPQYDILGDKGPKAIADQSVAGRRLACLQQQDKVVQTIRIRPTDLHDVNVTVVATVDNTITDCTNIGNVNKRDEIIKPFKVEAEGFPRERTWSKYICTKDIQENTDFLESWNMTVPKIAVNGSSRGWITASGDLMGPTLDNLGHLIQMPYGCGEQNMVNFAPNVFILQYLTKTNQSNVATTNKLLRYIYNGYQRQLNYRHPNASYSAFGTSDDAGSTWLTAFVVKSFAQATPFFSIDTVSLNQSITWLKNQAMQNGCFRPSGKILHKAMKGGAGVGIGKAKTNALLTSYTLAALLEAGVNKTSSTVEKAITCLKRDRTTSPYGMALKAYALSLAEHSTAKESIDLLLKESVNKTNTMYWNLPKYEGDSEAVQVEIAGYAVLAMLSYDALYYERPIWKVTKWLSTRRNGQGGFISTQDTVVALQALAKFEGLQIKDLLDLKVLINSHNLAHTFEVNEPNRLLQQKVWLPNPNTNITVDLAGNGCTLVQAVLRYNAPYPDPSESFRLSVTAHTAIDRSCKMKRIKACAIYTVPNEQSNMAVIEVNLVSGYSPVKDDLVRLVGRGGGGSFKRYEVDGRTVTFYVNEFTDQELCADFRITRDIDVEDEKPGTARVYDYYEPELSVSQSYTLPAPENCNYDAFVTNSDGTQVASSCWRRKWSRPDGGIPTISTNCLPRAEADDFHQ